MTEKHPTLFAIGVTLAVVADSADEAKRIAAEAVSTLADRIEHAAIDHTAQQLFESEPFAQIRGQLSIEDAGASETQQSGTEILRIFRTLPVGPGTKK